MSKYYHYEMLFRPCSIGCQPKDFVNYDHSKGRNGVLTYDRPLTEQEIAEYELKKWEEN